MPRHLDPAAPHPTRGRRRLPPIGPSRAGLAHGRRRTRGEQPFFQAIYDLASPRLVFGRVALLGDAAFVARPHVGAGVTKAALDAVCLATAIAGHGGDVDAALAHYGSERLRFGDWIVGRGRDLGASIGMRAGASARLDREELNRRAAAVVSAYAANAEECRDLPSMAASPAALKRCRGEPRAGSTRRLAG
jgi:2-polyprenyl-6-methoxyphenol hydroxylase-like FAD-dependent oxidoreductase